MRDVKIIAEFRELRQRVEVLEAQNRILASVLLDAQLALEAHGVCLREEVGLTPARSEKYRQMAMDARDAKQAALREQAGAVQAAPSTVGPSAPMNLGGDEAPPTSEESNECNAAA